MKKTDLAVIIGRGVSGNAAAELAAACGMDFIQFSDGEPAAENFKFSGEETVIISPGVGGGSELLRRAGTAGCEVIGEMEFAARNFPGRYVAVTGTNGKTTVTELASALFAAAGLNVRSCGNIGEPLSLAAAEIKRKQLSSDVWAVAETSSFQLESVRDFAPLAAVILNVKSDHLDRYHGSMEEYRAVKMRIFDHTAPENRIWGISSGEKFCQRVFPGDDGRSICIGGRKLLDFGECALRGEHNLENLCAALELLIRAAGEEAVFRPEVIQTAKNFRTGRHRLETVAVIDGVTFIDDSKATNPSGVTAALRALSGPVRLIAGGLDKGMDFGELLEEGGGFEKVKKVYLVGEAAERIAEVLPEDMPVSRFGKDFAAAVAAARDEAQSGETVLLSPACASMDMFRNYRERGDFFVANIRKKP